MSTSDDEMVVVRSIRQSFETSGGPGSSVNSTGNPFFVQLTGQFDLLKAATLIVTNLDIHREHKARIAREEAARHLQRAAEELKAAAGTPSGEDPKKDGTGMA